MVIDVGDGRSVIMKRLAIVWLSCLIVANAIVPFSGTQNVSGLVLEKTLTPMAYPNCTGMASIDADYWDAYNGTFVMGTTYTIGQQLGYVIQRVGLIYDTTAFNSEFIINNIELRFTVSLINAATDFDMELYQVDYTGDFDTTDWWNANRTGYLGSIGNTSNLVENMECRVSMPISMIVRGGYTELMIVSSGEGVAPTGTDTIQISDIADFTIILNPGDVGEAKIDVNYESNISPLIEVSNADWLWSYYPNTYIYYNETHQLAGYDFWLQWENYSWYFIQYNENIDFSQYNTNCTTNSQGSGWINITAYWTGYHRFYFIVPIYEPNTDYSGTIYPTSINQWNDTHDVYLYELELSRSADYAYFNISGSDYTYLSSFPPLTFATIDATTGHYNLTDIDRDANYRIWLLRQRPIIYCQVSIAMTHATLGTGIMWESLKVVSNRGEQYNATTAQRISEPTTYMIYGQNYTITVLDFFNNEIINETIECDDNHMDVIIDVPVHQLTLKSFRNDTTAYAIYFNGTGVPFQNHLPGDWVIQSGIREGTYMFRFDYLDSTENGTTTVATTAYYNLTINGTYTINIGMSEIQIIYTTISGVEIQIDEINTSLGFLNPDIVYVGYLLPYCSPEGKFYMERSSEYLILDPYAIYEATIRDNATGTSGTFYSPAPSIGTTVFIIDELQITSDFTTNIMLNWTGNGTNAYNFTMNPGVIDLTEKGLSNFTFWANGTINAQRKATIKNTAAFSWIHYPSIATNVATLKLNNTTPFDWEMVYWFVEFYRSEEHLPDTSSLTVYDQQNTVSLTGGRNYDCTQYGCYMAFTQINSTVERAFTFTYLDMNASWEQGTPIITIMTYPLATLDAQYYYKGTGTWNNQYSAPYSGDILISLKNLPGIIDPDTVVIQDASNGDNVPSFVFSGASITINFVEVGEVGVGEARSYDVFFLLIESEPEQLFIFKGAFSVGAVQFNLHLCMLLFGIAFAGYGTTEIIIKDTNIEDSRGMFYLLIGIVIICLYIILWILHIWGLI